MQVGTIKKKMASPGYFKRSRGEVVIMPELSEKVISVTDHIKENAIYVFPYGYTNVNLITELIDKLSERGMTSEDIDSRIVVFTENKGQSEYVKLNTRLPMVVIGNYLNIDKYQLVGIINSNGENMGKNKTPAELFRDTFGEVYTQKPLVEKMLDTVPEDAWKNPNTHFLDNSVGGGNFIVAVFNRLMITLKDVIVDEEDRRKHIIEKMLYFVDLQAKNVYFTMMRLGNGKEYKFNFVVDDSLKVDYTAMGLFEDVYKVATLGNPPYNGERGKNNASKHIFQMFVDKAVEISDYVVMVTPSRWLVQNSCGMKEFRDRMCGYGVRSLTSIDSQKEFKLNIEAGCSYFLIEKGYVGETNFNGKVINLQENNNKFGFITIDDNVPTNIKNPITEIMFCKGSFGIKSSFNGDVTGKYMCRVSSVKVAKNKLQTPYIKVNIQESKNNVLSKWKVVLPAARGDIGQNKLDISESIIFIEPPMVAVNESFVFFACDTEQEALRLKRWLLTDENKRLFKIKKIKQDITKETFELISMPPKDFV